MLPTALDLIWSVNSPIGTEITKEELIIKLMFQKESEHYLNNYIQINKSPQVQVMDVGITQLPWMRPKSLHPICHT